MNAATQTESVAKRFPRDQSLLSSPSAAPPGGGNGPGLVPEEAWAQSAHVLGPAPQAGPEIQTGLRREEEEI